MQPLVTSVLVNKPVYGNAPGHILVDRHCVFCQTASMVHTKFSACAINSVPSISWDSLGVNTDYEWPPKGTVNISMMFWRIREFNGLINAGCFTELPSAIDKSCS